MTYSESAKGITISPDRADKEIRSHGCEPEEFWSEVHKGKRCNVSATSVLNWLGY